MAQTIGAAGIKYGQGRVSALTKAINLENLGSQNQDSFIRMFMNVVMWTRKSRIGTNSSVFSPNNSVAIFSNDNEEFDKALSDLFSSAGMSVRMLPPWYEAENFVSNGNRRDLFILIPSYSALDGLKMKDDSQVKIMNEIHMYGAGLVVAEWFHLLNSIPAKRSFQFTDPNDFNIGWQDSNQPKIKGLIDCSPFQIDEDYLVFTNADEIVYTVEDINDSTSFAIPRTFSLSNFASDLPLNGNLTQISSAKDGSIIFWNTDIAGDEVTTTTTTTTTTLVPYSDIKLKVGYFYLENACGPQKLYLSGEHSDFFLLEGTDLFLTKNILDPKQLNFNIVAEDYFEHERFNRVVEHVSVNLIQCDTPVTAPKSGAEQCYSFRYGSSEVRSAWGRFAPVGVIVPFHECSFIGKGTGEEPAVICLGGKHNDSNAIWVQLNDGGEYNISVEMKSAFGEIVEIYLIQNRSGSNRQPLQHTSAFNSQSWTINATTNNSDSIVRRVATSQQFVENFSFSVNVDEPNVVDEDDIEITGDAYLVLHYKKDLYRSQGDDVASGLVEPIFSLTDKDKVCATITFGTTTTPPPPEFDFIVFIQNKAPATRVTGTGGDGVTAFKFTSIATTDIVENVRTFYINTTVGGEIFKNLHIIESSPYITLDIRSDGSQSKTIDVTLSEMPEGGGSTTIVITGDAPATTTTTTTTQPPRYPVRVSISDNLEGVYLDALTKEAELPVGLYVFTFFWYTNSEREYRLDNTAPSSNPYRYYDRPTITHIISQTVESPIPMVILPSPTPDSQSGNNTTMITVGRGISNWNNNFNDGNTRGTIYIPVMVPVLGGDIELYLGGDEPDTRTTTTTTQPPEPCDNTIYIICTQTLNCVDDGNGGCTPDSSSYQDISFTTCCEISDSQALSMIRTHKRSSGSLSQLYSSECSRFNFDLLAGCLPKDSNGNCQQTVHSQVIDIVSCGFFENPLP